MESDNDEMTTPYRHLLKKKMNDKIIMFLLMKTACSNMYSVVGGQLLRDKQQFVVGLKLVRINVFMICRKIGKLKKCPIKTIHGLNKHNNDQMNNSYNDSESMIQCAQPYII